MKMRLALFVLVGAVIAGCAVNAMFNARQERLVTVQAALPGGELGITTDENMQVVSIARGSVAEEAGIQVGDVLLAIVPLEPGDPDIEKNKEPRLVVPDTFTFPVPDVPSSQSDGAAQEGTGTITLPFSIPTEAIVMQEETWDPSSDVTETIPFREESQRADRKIQNNPGRVLLLQIRRKDDVIEIKVRPRITQPYESESDRPTPIPETYHYF
jgi:hypothetical protein